jgi:hypothetical protein
MNLEFRFWTAVREIAVTRLRTAYMRQYYHERRCPVCTTWTSEVGGARAVKDEDDRYELMQCARCDSWSRWDMVISMLPVLAKDQKIANITTMQPKE